MNLGEVKILKDDTDRIIEGIEEGSEKAMEAIGLLAERHAKKNLGVPKPHADGSIRPNIDTGRLVNSITHALESPDTVVIGTNVEYAA